MSIIKRTNNAWNDLYFFLHKYYITYIHLNNTYYFSLHYCNLEKILTKLRI